MADTTEPAAPKNIVDTYLYNMQHMGDQIQLRESFLNAAASIYDKEGKADRFLGFGLLDYGATTKDNTADTNLKALDAGGLAVGMTNVKDFTDIVRAHPDLKESVNNLLKDEGEGVLTGLQGLLTGDGAIDTKQLAEAMNNDAQRKVIVEAIDRAATDKESTSFVVEFSQKALKAAKDKDKKSQDDFLQFADQHGIDTSPLQQDAMKNMFANFFKDPEGTLATLVQSMNLPPEWASLVTGFAAPIVKMTAEIGNHYAFGDPAKGEPGGAGVGMEAVDQARERGEALLARVGSGAPAAPAVG